MAQGNEFESLTIAVFTGKANPALAQEITRHLHVPLGRAHVGRFSDGEVNVELMENVRGRDVFIVQPTNPPAENLMELLMMTDACRRASAKRITAVVPYFGYGRQDRRPRATRVFAEDQLAAKVSLHEADAFSAAQVDGRPDLHGKRNSPKAIALREGETVNMA